MRAPWYDTRSSDSFASSAHRPLFYALTAPFLRLTGASLLPGRLLAFLSAGGCVLLLAGQAMAGLVLPQEGRGRICLRLHPQEGYTTVDLWVDGQPQA